LIGIFILLPMLLTVWLSFRDWSTQTPFSSASFIGLDNFREIFGPTSVGRDFKGALTNTAIYTALSVVLILPLSVAFGLMVYQHDVAGGTALRTVLFSTYMVPMIAVALV
ncbi:sugar ABC transporter permease, partial [Mesorhizobium sp. M1C.F.Ca.ET.187.01.1.1]